MKRIAVITPTAAALHLLSVQLCLMTIAGGVIAGGGLLSGHVTADDELPLSHVGDLMATPRTELIEPRPVRVRGTISSVGNGIAAGNRKRQAARSFCVEENMAGIWVRSSHAIRLGIFDVDKDVLAQLEYGVDIELEGFLEKGGFAPNITPTRVTVLGKSELPEAPKARMREFLSGADDIRRVTVAGVVQNIADENELNWLCRVETGVGHFLVRLPKKDRFTPKQLLDAEIEVTGLAGASRNWRAEFVCPRLVIDHEQDIRVRSAAPSDPFSVTKVPIESFDDYSPQGRPLHRRRIEGVVTFYDGDKSLYIQDHSTGIHVQLNENEIVDIGDRVEVSGFTDTTRYLAGIRGAALRRLGVREDPKPIPMTMTQVIADHKTMRDDENASTRSCDGLLIQLSGRLLSFQPGEYPYPHRLELDCGDSITSAFLSGGTGKLVPGVELRVSGVADIAYAPPDETANLAMPTRVNLLMRGDYDIDILSHPSWWTVQRLFAAILIVTAIALFAFVWAFTMRRTLAKQTDRLALEMRNRRDAAIEFQGAISERTRLAANLHDTLLQTMAGIAYQLEACGITEASTADPSNVHSRSGSHLETARRMVQRGQDDLRNTVWALHCLPLDAGTFADSVNQVTRKIGTEYAKKITVTCVDDFPDLADFIAGNLLLLIQEAIHNAIKYSGSDTIEIDLDVTPDGERVRLTVRDHGKGFDANHRPTSLDGHFGIEGMEQRIDRLGGTFAIESQLGEGTAVHAEIPLREFDPKIA
ncbi:Signal transduction histidine-protein kinase/phosphatase DegS [Planctomycetes bacterium CA13]|uniref:Signal transduction histidine-protein kinase/phosphatase DegS n=1 Tax=Novipirellula herctigrandis TaxID=2527986 RepID=A0A5C5Z7W5_9BACT|nr:Signal transduction histidine-protein kinase/phosphatase DegS [Planctomycetes bacterium CA13]